LNTGIGGNRNVRRRWLRRNGLILLIACLPASFPCAAQKVAQPEIVSREAWGARPANTELMQEQKPAEIIVHHTGTRQQPHVSLEAKMRGLQDFGMKAGRVGPLPKPAWGDIPYHYYIDVAGKIGEGRDTGVAGDNATAFDNDGRIQITVEGDFEHERPTEKQLKSLMQLVTWLAAAYGVPADGIYGHGDFDQTGCPGRNLRPFLDELRKAVQKTGEAAEK